MKKKKKNIESIVAVIGIIIIILCIVFIRKAPKAPLAGDQPEVKKENPQTPITITEENIKEENFTATRSKIAGSSAIARAAEAYMDETIASFKKSADEEVPPMRAQFGADSPTANYEIDLKATQIKSEETGSIVIDQYIYTGGANGNSAFKVFTASKSTGKILSLSDVIASAKQGAFTIFVKKELTNWRPEGSEESVTFPEAIQDLTFSSFRNWAFDEKGNMVIYFDKYEIGPGVLGAVAFPLSPLKVKEFIAPAYL